ncbi:hypothetical protein CLIB1444_12S02124 [[Candida] jaroonii]|uniref:Uncharacterized protein n=1 Tax=[Candida] jaroonii TaxID=467808 RepID=A0ACA9YD55_9ASCO|nr:hypothetical protein CLIB1444_12S02124 [[Candida] jaroonii]
MSMKPKIKAFFKANRQYAVSGASNDPSKFGFKISKWYLDHELPVVPVNPKAAEILGQEVINSLPSVIESLGKKDIGQHKLKSMNSVSISFLTPPSITTKTLNDISKVDGFKDLIGGLWFQPGSYDETVLQTAEDLGLFDKVIFQDECILVRGEEGLYSSNL